MTCRSAAAARAASFCTRVTNGQVASTTFDAFSSSSFLVVDQRTQTADDIALLKGVLDHIDGPLNAETESVFVCE
jgi:hypothetical protein